MEWHINELSLSGQFSNPQAFRAAIEPLLQLRNREVLLRQRLYCSRLFHTCHVTPMSDLRQAVLGTRDKNFIGLVLEWMAKSGPFWNDERISVEDDYFEYKGCDVTDQGLGEAARRKIAGTAANSFSFQGSRPLFMNSPLQIVHGLPEAPIGLIDIDNYWDVGQLSAIIQSSKVYRNWADVDIEIRRRFTHLRISDNAIEPLLPIPFSEYVTKRIFELLKVLNEVVAETDENGELSPAGKTLLSNHFVGEKAWFTDESLTNKAKFKKDMTFPDPDDLNQNIFCPWHGKIKTPQIRIHFQWPRPAAQTTIKVVYIGPKITKK